MKEVFRLEGLDCAVCAGELEELIAKIEGVQFASVAFAAATLTVECESEEVLLAVKKTVNGFEEVRIVEAQAEETVLRIENLHCANCAVELERELCKIKGVAYARVDFLTQKVFLRADEQGVYRAVKRINRFEKVRVVDGEQYEKPKVARKEWFRILLAAILLGVGIIFTELSFGLPIVIVGYILMLFSYFTVGYDVLISTFKNLFKGRIFDENFLMSVASIGAFALGEVVEGVAVMLLYQLGELLQALAVGSSRRSVARLMSLKSESAIRINKAGEYEKVSPEELTIGDEALVRAGDKVPCDGVLTDEFAVLDMKSLTGEAELKNFLRGEELLSGSINAGNAFKMSIARAYEDSAVKKILDLVESSSAKKSKNEKFITKFARYYTPAVSLFALLFATLPPLISYFSVGQANFTRYLHSALTFLVISCPCALVISVPLSYFAGIGACAKKGVLVKGATYLDTLTEVKTVAFDKTGTLTEGAFQIVKVFAKAGEERAVLSYASALEKESSHPIAKAFEKVECPLLATNVAEVAGKGIRGEVDGKEILFGNALYLQEKGIVFVPLDEEYTTLYLAVEGEYFGAVTVGDKIREGAKNALEALQVGSGVKAVMLTGDTARRASSVAAALGIKEVRAGLLPADKVFAVEELKGAGRVLYVGDGINDAPVMMAADCALSMGKLGSAAAVEASDLVLISENLSALPVLFKTAKKVKRIVWQNVVFSIGAKLLFMALGALGILPLALAVFADVGIMLLAVCNSFRIS